MQNKTILCLTLPLILSNSKALVLFFGYWGGMVIMVVPKVHLLPFPVSVFLFLFPAVPFPFSPVALSFLGVPSFLVFPSHSALFPEVLNKYFIRGDRSPIS